MKGVVSTVSVEVDGAPGVTDTDVGDRLAVIVPVLGETDEDRSTEPWNPPLLVTDTVDLKKDPAETVPLDGEALMLKSPAAFTGGMLKNTGPRMLRTSRDARATIAR